MPDPTSSLAASVTPANVPPLPAMGSAQDQLNKAQYLIGQLQSGNPAAVTNLLGAGITTVTGAVGGSVGALARTMVSIGTAAASGAAVGGPFGALGGLIVGIGASLANALTGGSQEVYGGLVLESTTGSVGLYKRVATWDQIGKHAGLSSGNPQGVSFLAYLMATYPAHTTGRGDLLWMVSDDGNTPVDAQSPNGLGQMFTASGPGDWPPTAADKADAKNFLAFVQNADPWLFWKWAEPQSGPTDTPSYAMAFEPAGATPPSGTRGLWQGDTFAIPPSGHSPGMTVADIMASAERRRPDPLYYAADPYVGSGDSTTTAGTYDTFITNTATLSGLATVLGMLAVGASTRAIVSELLLQQHLLFESDGPAHAGKVPYTFAQFIGPGGTFTVDPSNPRQTIAAAHAAYNAITASFHHQGQQAIPPLFRQLVEDYLALAHLEGTNPHASMQDAIRIVPSAMDQLFQVPPAPKAPSPPAPPTPPTSSAKAQATQTISHFITMYLHV